MANKNILVVGGAGYIGSHMTAMLSERGYFPVVFDNLSTGHRSLIPKNTPFIKGDIRHSSQIKEVFGKYPIDTVMHFAASIVVQESVADPLKYYENNFVGSLNLIKAMIETGRRRLIFSSTGAVYGEPGHIPVNEKDPTNPTSPYGESKLMVERLLRDVSRATRFSYISLRYFNVCGADPSGWIGSKKKNDTLLIPNILKVALGLKKELLIYGDDYPTPDGTCIRDYIHVTDLCEAHLLAMEALRGGPKSDIFNLGNEKGYSVKEVVHAAEAVIGQKIKVKIMPRRAGDPARIVAAAWKAKKVLKWRPKMDLNQMIRTAWVWEKKSAN